AQRPDVAGIAERGPAHAAAARRPQLTVQHSQERALARTVRAGDEPMAPLLEPPVDRVQHAPVAEPDVRALDLDQRQAARGARAARRRCRRRLLLRGVMRPRRLARAAVVAMSLERAARDDPAAGELDVLAHDLRQIT